MTFATGRGPVSVTTADLNGDGLSDLIVANETDNDVSVLLNITTPGATAPAFATQQTFATGTSPQNVVAADLIGDGQLDLVVTNQTDNDVSVLLNTTTPGATTFSFATQQTFAVGSGPLGLAVADLNGDGLPDLVTANSGSDDVSVLLGLSNTLGGPGTGTIVSAPVVSSIALTDSSPTDAAAVDFTVTFSKAVSGVTASNFSLTGTGTSGASIGTPVSSDGGTIWTAPVITGAPGTLGLDLSSRTGITDAVGNQLYTSTSDNGSTFTPFVGAQYTIRSAPTISAVSPGSGPATGGTAIAITGTDFLSGATVTVGGASATNVVVVSVTEITAITPAGTAGAAAVVVTNTDGGTFSDAAGFSYATTSTSTGTSGTSTGTSAVVSNPTGFVSVAFGPQGEIVEVVNSTGVLTQYDASGVHVLVGGVQSASVAFGPRGEVLLVTYQDGSLVEYDATGAHVLAGRGAERERRVRSTGRSAGGRRYGRCSDAVRRVRGTHDRGRGAERECGVRATGRGAIRNRAGRHAGGVQRVRGESARRRAARREFGVRAGR